MAGLSRRDRKRQQTRAHIAETARALFAERGFESVTVAEIAEAADVSEQTVYNHFSTKEDLVFWRRGAFEAELVSAIRDRPPGESALSAFSRFVTRPRGMPANDDPAVRASIETSRRNRMDHPASPAQERIIMDSPGLLARERSIIVSYTASLAELLAEETGARPDDIEPWVVSAAMLGVTQALIDYARRRVVEGAKSSELEREVGVRADRAVKLLGRGLADYAVRGSR